MKSLCTVAVVFCFIASAGAQVGIGTATPSPHAVLELHSPTNNQGFLVPRLTTAQRSAIGLTSDDNGLLVFDSDEQKFYYWQTSQWLPLRSGTDVNLVAGPGIDITANTISAVPDGDGDATNEIQDLQLTGNTLKITNNASATPIDLSPLIDADGDATNEIQDLQLTGATLKITGNATATSIDLAPFLGANTDNQTLSFDGATGTLSITGGNNVTLSATGTASGDLTGSYPAPTIAAGAGNNIVSAINNGSTTGTIAAGRLDGTVVLDTESPAAADVAGSFASGLSINDQVVTTAKLSDAAVTTGKLNDGAVTTAKLDDGAVTTAKLSDGAVTTAKIATGAVTNSKIPSGGISPNRIAPSATSGQVLTTVSGVAQWADAPSGTGGLADVLSRSGDAENENAFNFNSITITNAKPTSGTGALKVTGSHFVSFTEISEDYTVKPQDYIIVYTPIKGPAIVTLPEAQSNKGRILIFRSGATNSTDALVLGAKELIDGETTSEPLYIDPTFNDNVAYAVTILSTGSTWITISRSIGKSKG